MTLHNKQKKTKTYFFITVITILLFSDLHKFNEHTWSHKLYLDSANDTIANIVEVMDNNW